jgi:outer membrane protein assembly factor BamB
MGHDAETGKEIWRARCMEGDVAPSPVYHNELVYAAHVDGDLVAIRPTGSGDVTDTHVIWSAFDGLPDICSPVSNGTFLFLLTSSDGQVTCYNSRSGELVWQHQLREVFTASPSIVDDRLFLLSDRGSMIVLAAKGEFEEIGRAELGERTSTSPAFVGDRLLIRGEKHLYCIGETQVQ